MPIATQPNVRSAPSSSAIQRSMLLSRSATMRTPPATAARPHQAAEPAGAGLQAGEQHHGPGADLEQPEHGGVVPAEDGLDGLRER